MIRFYHNITRVLSQRGTSICTDQEWLNILDLTPRS